MTDSLIVDALGIHVEVGFDADIDVAQRELIRSTWTGALNDRDRADVTVDVAAGENFERSMERLTIDVTLAALAARRGEALMFHAAGVATDDGRVVAFVGPSGRGKTTLSRALGAQFGYVSDETIAVEHDLSIQPYRKPLSIVRDGQPKQQISPEEAGLRPLPSAPLRFAALTLLERDPEMGEPRVESVALSDALPELVAQMSYLSEFPQPLQSMARMIDAVGGVRRLRYSEASSVPPTLIQVLDAAPAASGWKPASRPETAGPYGADHLDDAIFVDGTVVVMVDSTLHVLGGIAPVTWQVAAQGASVQAIVDAVVAEFGSPPSGDARELVQGALDELVENKTLQRR